MLSVPAAGEVWMSDDRGTLKYVTTRTLNGYEHLTALVDAIPASPANSQWRLRARDLSGLLEVEGVFAALDVPGQQEAARHVAGCLVHGSDGFTERVAFLLSQSGGDPGPARDLATAVQRAGDVIALF